MRRRGGRILLALLAAAALAGCSGDGGPGASADGLAAGDTTGLVRGVTFDEAVRPLAGVALTLTIGALTWNGTSAPDGSFGWDGLGAGSYQLTARLLGHEEARQTVTVEADLDDPPAVGVMLPSIPGFVAYHEQFAWDGFIECGMGGLATFAACAVPNVVSGMACSASGTCPGTLTQDRFCATALVSHNATLAQSEMVWEATQAGGDLLRMILHWGTVEEEKAGNSAGVFDDATGPSPVVLGVEQEKLNEAGVGIGGVGLTPCAYAAGDGSNPVGLAVQQRFTFYTTAFFGYLPPDGWTFVGAGAVPPPA